MDTTARDQSKGRARPAGRREQRLFAFKILYSLPFCPERQPEDVLATFDSFALEHRVGAGDEKGFAWILVNGVVEHLDKIDEVIGRYSRNWKLDRIARVELAIMRLAVFEILCQHDIPAKVTMNEAVEIAKQFGDEHSKNFINGILDAVAKDAENGKLGPCPQN
ncbi:MAG: transcription antitermination factor NusB [Desulfonatronovibrionaceae bacterium]